MNSASHAHAAPPSAWVARFAPSIAPGEVLDLACGSGRHARLLAGLGHPVLAADRDAGALQTAAGPGITTLACDFEAADSIWPFAVGRFAGIVMCNYLHRPLWPQILASLAPGGMLIVETFAVGNGAFGKPSNPDFLLQHGELLAALAAHCPASCTMRIDAYEDGYIELPRPAMVQRVCARKIALGAAENGGDPARRVRLDR